MGSWPDAAGELALAAAWVVLPGLLLLRATGVRGLTASLAAPAVSVGVLAVLAIALPVVGVPWTRVRVGAVVLALVAVLYGLRRVWARLRGVPRQLPTHEPGSRLGVGMALVGVVAGGILAAFPLAGALPPDVFRESWDPVFHLSATRFAVETQEASPFAVSLVSNQTASSGSFYPAAWHALAALGTLGSVVRATNALVLVVAGVVWPMGLAALARVTVPRHPAAALLAPVVGAGFFAFPTFLVGWGYPNALSVALIAGALAFTAMVVRHVTGGAASGAAGGSLALAVAAVVSLAGVALAHPNGALSYGVIATPLVVMTAFAAAVRCVRTARSRARGVVGAVAWMAAAALWCAAWWAGMVVAGRGIADTSQTGTAGMREGVWRALTGSVEGPRSALLWALLLGVGAVAVAWQRGLRWMLVSLVAVVALAGLAEDESPWKWITRAWFMDPARLRAPAVILVALIVAIGLAAVSHLLIRTITRSASPAHARLRRSATLEAAVCGALAVVLVATTGGLQADQRRDFFWDRGVGLEQRQARYTLLSTPELEMIKRLDGELTPGARILGSPFAGTTFAYVVGGIPVVFTNFGGRWSADAQLLRQRFAAIHEDPEVCAALKRLDARYFYADTTLFHPGHSLQKQFAGLPTEPPQPGFELVDSGGTASVYRITACD